MPRILPIAVLVGLAAGILVGGYHNLFTVPVIEQAIALEEAAAAAAHPAGMPAAAEPPLVSLGAQRIGMVVGTAVFGVVLGVVFAGGFFLLRRAMPRWSPLLLALTVGAVGFWALSLLPFLKYPVNPPGVGSEETLLFRQGFQFLFLALSGLGAVGLVLAMAKISRLTAAPRRMQLYGLAVAAYVLAVVVIFSLLPGNPDPVATPPELLARFRTLSIIGQLLQWALMAVGVALVLRWVKPVAPEPASPEGRPAPRPARR